MRQQPQLFLMLGDNIYGDTEDMGVLAEKYRQQAEHPDFSVAREAVPMMATWDDHDYCVNDAGVEFAKKEQSKELFLDFFGVAKDSERRRREGVYSSKLFGPPGRRVQVILLDTRWGRSPLHKLPRAQAKELNKRTGKGPYTPVHDREARMLNEEQWQWLEEQLRQPAEVRIIGSSIPVLHENSGWETWDNFPNERDRLYRLLERTGAEGVLFVSGDSHRGEFSRKDEGLPYPLWEVNSSGLTENGRSLPPNANRLGKMYMQDNFGMIHIDWAPQDPQITLELRDVNGNLVTQNILRLSQLRKR